MRLIKMLGLAATAAVAAMAFVGATAAVANENTALCTEASVTLACPEGKIFKGAVHFVAVLPELLSSSPTMLCKEVLLSGNVESPFLAKPLGIKLTSLTFKECHVVVGFLFNCTVETLHVGLLTLLKTAANLGVLNDVALPRLDGKAGTEFSEVRVTCPAIGIDCEYVGEGLPGHALSAEVGNNGTVNYVKSPVKILPGQEGCPESATLDAKFVSLTPLWIRS